MHPPRCGGVLSRVKFRVPVNGVVVFRSSSPISRAAVVLAGLALATPLAAHDFWIVPDAFQVAPGSPLTFRTVTGVKFAVSESPITADRLADARILSADPARDERLGDFSVSGKSLIITHRPTTPGQRVVVLALAPGVRRMTGEAFMRYLKLEGAGDNADRLARNGTAPPAGDSIAMRSTKFAKTLAEVGQRGPRAFQRLAGQALEFVPRSDPSTANDALAIQVLAQGRPVPGAHVHAGRAAVEGEQPEPDLSLTADADGVVRVPITKAGLWNVRTAFVSRSAPGGAAPEWVVDWATFVFSVGGHSELPRPSPSGFASDSSDVVNSVAHFHDALARGDSVAALAILASDVTILESGDLETRDQYRSHHLPADIGFARAIPSGRTVQGVTVHGNAAWVSATSVTTGTFNGRAINSAGAELTVLSRSSVGAPWQIRAVHWSSHRRP